jgi:hypothetical protein
MKLSWIFGSSMEARHLLYAYVAVWLIQGGYAAWIAWQWKRTRTLSTLYGEESVPRDNS